jgi:rhamnose utilization protein RhaD (predicted bifunctional aldolase and dehydrogenase)
MDEALSQLIRISKKVGKDNTLVQGGGGNTSVKTADGKHMYIKASGMALKDMSKSRGWRRMRLDSVLLIVKDKSIARLETHAREIEVVNRLLLACDDKVTGTARPSVEAHLHGFLDKCVIHLHPSAAGAFVNAKNGKAMLEILFKTETIPPLWVPYTDPGSTLAKKIASLVGNYQKQFGKKPAILFLHKHGLFITTGSADTALRLVHKVIKRCNSKLRQPRAGKIKSVSQEKIKEIKPCIRRAFFEATGEQATISYFNDNEIADFMAQKDAKEMLAAGVLTPDELVYSNGPAMWVEQIETADIAKRLTLQIKKGEKHSVAFLVKNVGLFVASKKKVAQTVRDIVAYSAFIRSNAKRMGGICSLNKRQRDFINKWEAEAFRKKVASGETAKR